MTALAKQGGGASKVRSILRAETRVPLIRRFYFGELANSAVRFGAVACGKPGAFRPILLPAEQVAPWRALGWPARATETHGSVAPYGGASAGIFYDLEGARHG
jgi:hypothetical protein